MKTIKLFLPVILIAFALMFSGCDKDDKCEPCEPCEPPTKASLASLLLGTWEEIYYVSYDLDDDGVPFGHDIQVIDTWDLHMVLSADETFNSIYRANGTDYVSTGKYTIIDSDTPAVRLTYDEPEQDGTFYTVEYTIVTLSDSELVFRELRIKGTPTADQWRPNRSLGWDMHYTRSK